VVVVTSDVAVVDAVVVATGGSVVDVVTGGAVVVELVVEGGRVVEVVEVEVLVVRAVAAVLVVEVADAGDWCSGREFSVKTRTSNNNGLDHINRCELRRVNRRRDMVIED